VTAGTQGDERKIRGAAALRSVEAAALAGLAHAALSLISTYLLLRAPRPEDGTADVLWYADEANQRSTALGLNLMAIGTIAFLWFVAVIRRRVGERENRFFGTVFLGSALLLAGTRMIAGILLAAPAMSAYAFDITPDVTSIGLWRAAGLSLATIVGTRLEAVFIISTTTVGKLSGALPKWLIWMGYVAGLTLLIAPLTRTLLIWLFPVWIILASTSLLIRHRQLGADPEPAVAPAP
jgi:MFS family permease